MVTYYVWLAQTLLVTLVAALGAHLATSYVSAKLVQTVVPKSTHTPQAREPQPQVTFAQYQVIVTRNIFNAHPPSKTPPPAPKPPPPVVPPVPRMPPLRLELTGTVTRSNSQRFAIIEDLGQQGTQAVYQIGDMVQQATIIDIGRDCVVLDQNGQHTAFCLPRDTEETRMTLRQPPASSPTPTSPSPFPTDDNADIVQVDATTWQVRRDLFLEQLGSFQALSAQAKLRPYSRLGQSQGFLLTRTMRGSILGKIGVRNGDILQQVNGVSIAMAQEDPQAFPQLQKEATVQLEILRHDRTLTLTYELR